MTTWEIFGIRHAVNRTRKRGQNFINDADPLAPLQMDFYCWVLRSGDRVIVVDTGMDPVKGAATGNVQVISPVEAWRALGIDPAAVDTVVLTHAHYDHMGYLGALPTARFLMQAEEMAYVTGPLMEKATFRQAYKPDEIGQLVTLLHGGRLHLHGRELRIADGVSAHWVGGHCAGQEVLRVRTARGWVVLASDALHYYEELDRGVPFAIAVDLGAMLAAHDLIRELADSEAHIIPAHDPLIADLYPAVSPDLAGRILQLDATPAARDS